MQTTFNHPDTLTNTPELSVSEVSLAIKNTIERTFSQIRVRGELSKVTLAKSGHLYTALKDDAAVLDAVCWRGTVARLPLRPEEGMEVVCTGRLTTYPGRSNYQLVIDAMELAGQGAILKMLEQRKQKLAAEGLFAPERKKPLPFMPRCIGVVTSPTGAVIRDILHRIEDRFPCRVLVWPAIVQGAGAAAEVARGIAGLNAMADGPDVIIVARGGGSFEDLMPFNDEALVRAAAASRIPLISAVGHETDVTLIDFAADARAPTPTGAAEIAVPVKAQLQAQVMDYEKRLLQGWTTRIDRAQTALRAATRPLASPARVLEGPAQRLDRASLRADHALERLTMQAGTCLDRVAGRLRTPQDAIRSGALRLEGLDTRLKSAPGRMLDPRAQNLTAAARMLESLSFKKVLERGYTVLRDDTGRLIAKRADLKPGQDVTLTLHDGTARARVTQS